MTTLNDDYVAAGRRAEYTCPNCKVLQAEIERLKTEAKDRQGKIEVLRAALKIALQALEKYADQDNWTNGVGGYGGPLGQNRWFNTLDKRAWSIASDAQNDIKSLELEQAWGPWAEGAKESQEYFLLENNRLRKALEVYADSGNWVHSTTGPDEWNPRKGAGSPYFGAEVARAALEKRS